LDLEDWGDYTFNLNGGYTVKETETRARALSMATGTDPRLWQGNDDLVRVRHYWFEDRPYPLGSGGIPTSLFRRDFATNNNTWTTSTQSIQPRQILIDWSDFDNRFLNWGLVASAKYFGGKLVVLPAVRFDDAEAEIRNRVTNFADLPSNWDGNTVIFRPDAPADWADLTYIPRDANGNVVLQYGPADGLLHPIWTKQPYNTVATLAYTTKLGAGLFRMLEGSRGIEDWRCPIG